MQLFKAINQFKVPKDSPESNRFKELVDKLGYRETMDALVVMSHTRNISRHTIDWQMPLVPPEHEGWNITDEPGVLPINLLQARCESIHVEFLRISKAENSKNHAIIKVDFSHDIGTEIDGESCYGARISMEVDPDKEYPDPEESNQPRYNPGILWVKPLRYELGPESSLRTLRVRITRDIEFVDIMTSLVGLNLHRFDFTIVEDKYYGCRDYMFVTKTPS